MRVVVVGAGCFGLSSAIRLLQSGYRSVAILSRARTPHTTSDGAGALWRPVIGPDDPMVALYDRWGQHTLTVLGALVRDFGHLSTGCSWVGGYEFSDAPLAVPPFSNYIPGFRKVGQEELRQLNLPGKFGFNFTSIIADMATYLPFLHRQFEQLGGQYVDGAVESFAPPYSHSSPAVAALLASADLLVNCTGLAPATLLGDRHMRPVRGYLVRVAAPFLHQWLYSNDTKAYLFPRHRDCVLGGTFDTNQTDTTPNATARQDVIDRCAALVPDVRHCAVLNEWVGLRPWRDVLRLELEWPGSGRVECVGGAGAGAGTVAADGAGAGGGDAGGRVRLEVGPAGCGVPLIHNYGAGGSGMTIHWGCAEEVVELARRVAAPDGSAAVGIAQEHGFVAHPPTSL